MGMKIYTSKRKGGILIDVIVGAMITVLAALSFLALNPVIKRSQVIAAEHTTANKIAVRVIEHLQLLQPSNVNASTLSALNLIDSGQTASPYAFTNIPLDDASRYSPSKALKNGTGTMTVTPLAANSVMVKIQINWTSTTGKAQSLSTGTVIGGYR